MPQPRYLEWAKQQPASAILSNSSVYLPSVRNAIQQQLAEPAWFEAAQQANPWGHPRLQQALQAWHTSSYAPLIVAGASSALAVVCQALLQPGDHALIETPHYEPFQRCVLARGATWSACQRHPISFEFELAQLATSITPRTKLVLLSNLHNPSGNLSSKSQLLALQQTLNQTTARLGLAPLPIVVDEIYWHLVAQPEFGSVAELGEQWISINSLAKVYGLSMLRCGWIMAAPPMLEQLRPAYLDLINIGSPLTEYLAAMVIEQLPTYQMEAQRHVAANRQIVHAALQPLIERELLRGALPEAGCSYFPSLNLPVAQISQVAALTGCVPGGFFGPAYHQHVRLGFGGDSTVVAAGLDLFQQTLRRLSQH
ncbi:pyridoxal phosphate-dependent aminotransferase [Herpetosiphon giganteus]|uniref:pyridoxal phosphate-dependent aminotransferase n=1 Tax=Herpetosiphon giganteus TaxID=2029754 RepID=UPI0019567C7C|nr:pyridoxal phosphate-dependent aminotransferase [Herpetosiphon giganteus]MBM7841810.1 aspartate/methionine/tyrosine aminotransferase [Herpetosiphon giganteus]